MKKISQEDSKCEGNERQDYLLNNYLFLIDQLFRQDQLDINALLGSGSKLLEHDKYRSYEDLLLKGEELKNKLAADESGVVEDELRSVTHLPSLDNAEQPLKGNPFYQLASDLYICFYRAAKEYFLSRMQQQCSYAPQKINPVKSWALTVLGYLTFILSTMTTAYGVNHMLVDNNLAILSLFQGDSGEIPRLGIALICGMTLSYIILHLKGVFFRGILSQGEIFKGIKSCYLRHPLIIVLSTLFMLISLKTNYDGGIALISKSEYINEQHQLIKKQSIAALESDLYGNKEGITSFAQSVSALKASTKVINTQFGRFIQDEAKGAASSGHVGHGPRYWGKYFVINGGHGVKGQNVAKFTSSRLANRVDAIIISSGIDFSQSLPRKIEQLVEGYTLSVKQQREQVQKLMDDLDQTVVNQDGLMPKFITTAFVEYYDLNVVVKTMADSYAQNATLYNVTVDRLKELLDHYIEVLRQIDRAGIARAREYNVEVKVPAIDVSAVVALAKDLPEVHYLGFAELIDLLRGKYGVGWAQFLMLLILILSALVDLADVVFLSPFLADQGRREAELIQAKQDELNDWEEKFLKQCHLFFYDDETTLIFNRLVPSNGIFFVDSFYRLLEEVSPNVIDPQDRSLRHNLWRHFISDFQDLHTVAAKAYNDRVDAIQKLIDKSNQYLTHYWNIIFPMLDDIVAQGDFTFDEIDRRVQAEQNRAILKMQMRVEELSLFKKRSSFYSYFMAKRRVKGLEKRLQVLERLLGTISSEESSGSNSEIEQMKKFELMQEKERITEQLAQDSVAMRELHQETEGVIKSGKMRVSRLDIWWKIFQSFLNQGVASDLVAGGIITRRSWLSMMGHRIDRNREEAPEDDSKDGKGSKRRAKRKEVPNIYEMVDYHEDIKAATAVFSTTLGEFEVELFLKESPKAAWNFINLAEGRQKSVRSGNFYDGLIFHRVMKEYMIQGGCPNGAGTGNPGYYFENELSDQINYDTAGIVSMAGVGKRANGSQFFITLAPLPNLKGKFTPIGKIVKGMGIIKLMTEVEMGQFDRPADDITIKNLSIKRVG